MEKIDKIFLKAAVKNDPVRMSAALAGDISDLFSSYLGRANIHAQDNKGRNAGMLAALHGHQQVVLGLLGNRLNMNQTCNAGRTILHYAAMGGNFDLIKQLVEMKPDLLKRQDNNGMTPFLLGMANKISDAALAMLIAQGADINVANNYGDAPIHYAAQQGRVSTLQLLLEHKADVNKQNSRGETALHICLRPKNSDSGPAYPVQHIARMLIEAGANPYIANNSGVTLGNNNLATRLYEEALARKEGRTLPPAPPPVMQRVLGKLKGSERSKPEPAKEKVAPVDSPIRQAFVGEGLDPDSSEQWRTIGDAVIEHIIGSSDNPRVLITTFNFVARQCIVTNANLVTGQSNALAVTAMDNFGNSEFVAQAHQKLQDAGKTPPALWPQGAPQKLAKKGLEDRI